MDASAKTYHGLQGLSYTEEYRNTSSSSDEDHPYRYSVSLQQPDKFRWENLTPQLSTPKEERLIVRSNQQHVEMNGLLYYWRSVRTKEDSSFGAMPGIARDLLADLLEGTNPLRNSPEAPKGGKIHTQIRYLGEKPVPGGKAVGVRRRVWFQSAQPDEHLFTELTLYFDAATKLLLSYQERSLYSDGTSGPGQTNSRLFNTRINPDFADGTFVFSPPPGSRDLTMNGQPYWSPELKVGAIAPDISGNDLDGKPRSLAKLKGKEVLVIFTAPYGETFETSLSLPPTWLIEKAGMSVLGVAIAKQKNRVLEEIDGEIPYIWDPRGWESDIVKRYGLTKVPFTILIDKDGKIKKINPNSSWLDDYVNSRS